MTAPDFRPLGFGEILDGAFTLYRRNLLTFLLTALIPTLALVGLMARYGGEVFAALFSEDPARVLDALGTMFLSGIAASLLYMVMWAALTRETAQAYLGHGTSVGDGFGTALRKLLPILGAAFVAGGVLVVLFFALAFVLGIVVGVLAGGGTPETAVLLSGLAGLAMTGMFLLVMAMLFAVLPAIIVEDKGPIEAIARSFDLARGAVGRVLGLMLVTLIIVYLPGLAVAAVTGGFADAANPDALPSVGRFVTQQMLGLGVSVLTTPFMASVIVLLYFDRRVRTEALDVQMAAERLAPTS